MDHQQRMEPAQMTQMADNGRLAIEAWMTSNLKQRGYDRYDDLHIDQIDQTWRDRDSWIEGGLQAFRTALEIRNKSALDVSVVLAYSLDARSRESRNLDFWTTKELLESLGSSPPSLYLFQKGREPWTAEGLRNVESLADKIVVENLSSDALRRLAPGKSCYYMEFRQIEFGEYSRTIFFAG
jgi:hypothetical protein